MEEDGTNEARAFNEGEELRGTARYRGITRRQARKEYMFSDTPDHEMIQAFGQCWQVYSMTLQYDGRAAALEYLDFLLGRTWNPIAGWKRDYLVKFRDRLAAEDGQ